MYPHPLEVFGTRIGLWNLSLLSGIVAGYPVLRASFRRRRSGALPRLLPLRWLLTAYVSALGAQLFAYAFDHETSLLPPPDMNPLRYYFDPLVARKTLYGAIVFLPLSAFAVSRPWGDLGYREALDTWTPAMFTVLAFSRIGCFLQGCCWGMPSETFGLRFPPGSGVHWDHAYAGLAERGQWTVPVVPTQLIEAVALAGLAAISFARQRSGGAGVFLGGIVAYSLVRFGLEFARADLARNSLGPFSTSQWIAIAIVAGAAVWRWRER